MKKKILLALAVFIVTAVPFSVFAATSGTQTAKNIRGFFGIDSSKFTDKQKADVKDYSQKFAQLQKDFINKMVSNGALTKEQGEEQIKRIDEALKNGGENGFIPGFGKGKGGMHGFEKFGEPGSGKIDASKLTDAQKAELTAIHKQMAASQKEYVNKLVSQGILPKTQGDTITAQIDQLQKSLETDGLDQGLGMRCFDGLGIFGRTGIDTSKFTEQQKADMKSLDDKMAGFRKDYINKLVSFGLLTREQGDTTINKMETMEKFREENGFSKGMGMKKGRFGRYGNPGNSSENKNQAPNM